MSGYKPVNPDIRGYTMVKRIITDVFVVPTDKAPYLRIMTENGGYTQVNRLIAWPFAIYTGKRVYNLNKGHKTAF